MLIIIAILLFIICVALFMVIVRLNTLLTINSAICVSMQAQTEYFQKLNNAKEVLEADDVKDLLEAIAENIDRIREHFDPDILPNIEED